MYVLHTHYIQKKQYTFYISKQCGFHLVMFIIIIDSNGNKHENKTNNHQILSG